MTDAIRICEACGQQVSEDTDVVRARIFIDAPPYDGPDDQVEGIGVFFHAGHFPETSRRCRRIDQDSDQWPTNHLS